MTVPLWTGSEIAAATGGVLSAPFSVNGVAFDSREVQPGGLFLALRGEHADGHAFVPEAARRGAAGFIVSKPVPYPNVRVEDGMEALLGLARAARARTAATVVGVTGSVGKTSVKEALRAAFQRMAPGATHASEKSYNNHTGVPLSLARMPRDSRFAVLEMGMNHPGEIARLTALVRPQVALVTWVGAGHLQAFPDGEAGVARAKAEIFEGVEKDGVAVIPADNAHAALLEEKARARGLAVLSFGRAAGAGVRLLSATETAGGSDIVADVCGRDVRAHVGIAGAHWVGNALAVLATAEAAGGDLAAAAEALATLVALPGRGARIDVALPGGTALLIDESYNANPVSMAAALNVLAGLPGRHLAVLGAMRELGAEGPARHRALAPAIAAAGIEQLALVGAEMEALSIDGVARFSDGEEAISWVRQTLRAGDVLLVKGSNSVGLQRLVQAIGGGA